jgi:hypothetical protein
MPYGFLKLRSRGKTRELILESHRNGGKEKESW